MKGGGGRLRFWTVGWYESLVDVPGVKGQPVDLDADRRTVPS